MRITGLSILRRRRITIPLQNEELLRRKELNYPPYAAFLKITVWDKNEERANGTAKEIADFLERQAKKVPMRKYLARLPALLAKCAIYTELTCW